MKIAVFPKAYIEQLSTGEMDLIEWIEQAATLGADGLELYPLFLKKLDVDYLEHIKEIASDYNLTIPMMCSSPDFTHPDPSYRKDQVEKMKQMIDAMTVLGTDEFRSCRVLSGQRRPEVSREDGIRWTVEGIQTLLPYAEQRNVHLVMENHYKDGFWIYPEFAQDCDIFIEIVSRISSKWFGVNYDPSNALVAGTDPLALLREIKSRVITMHASDRHLKPGYSLEELKQHSSEGYSSALVHGVIGQGLNDYDAIFEELRSVNFQGWISIEDGVNGMDELRESIHFLKGKVVQYQNER